MVPFRTTPRDLKVPPASVIFGRSEVMRMVRDKLEKIAVSNIPVLIQGESGTGKELIARWIHSLSPWAAGPFVKVNCPATDGTLLGSELFVLEREVPNDARREQAGTGTLFLDEVAELDAGLQAKLLQVLQDGSGAPQPGKAEVRLLCATNRQLADEVEAGNFRQDLFYRINVLTVRLPALRDRSEDIPELAAYLLALYSQKYNCKADPLSDHLLHAMQEYRWPGNIRELENLIKRYVILGAEDSIAAELIAREVEQLTPEIPLDGSVSLKKMTRVMVRQLERQVILRSLQANNWNRKRVARALDISYRALLYKIRDAGLSSRSARPVATPTEMPGEVGSQVKAA